MLNKSENKIMVSYTFTKLPEHVGIIMDGNGRWAKSRHRPRVFGHREGVRSVDKIVEVSTRLGIKALTLYSFSTENWIRPDQEKKFLFNLLISYLKKETKRMMNNDIKFQVFGDISRFSDKVIKALNETIDTTGNNKGLHLNLALNYGAQQEIIRGINRILEENKKNINIDEFDDYLYTKNEPDLDFLIRTSGEYRLSNFLLWQSAYTEFYFTDIYWPDFKVKQYLDALKEYEQRHRRYGDIK